MLIPQLSCLTRLLEAKKVRQLYIIANSVFGNGKISDDAVKLGDLKKRNWIGICASRRTDVAKIFLAFLREQPRTLGK